MVPSTTSEAPTSIRRTLHARFLNLLPTIERQANLAFRDIGCRSRREEAIAECVALAWIWYLRLLRRGKDPDQFPTVLARYAAQCVRAGRRLCGRERAKDVLSWRAQRQHGFTVGPLLPGSRLHGNVFGEALRDNTQTTVPEQVAFRLDFPRWRGTHTERDQRLLDDMMLGERTQHLATRYGLTKARIAQKRREFHEDWQRFQEDGDSDRSGQDTTAC